MLQPYLAGRLGCPVHYLHGGTPKKQRDGLVSGPQDATEPSLFILSLKAGGSGLKLTTASHVIHVERWWDPARQLPASHLAFQVGLREDALVRQLYWLSTQEHQHDGT